MVWWVVWCVGVWGGVGWDHVGWGVVCCRALCYVVVWGCGVLCCTNLELKRSEEECDRAPLPSHLCTRWSLMTWHRVQSLSSPRGQCHVRARSSPRALPDGTRSKCGGCK